MASSRRRRKQKAKPEAPIAENADDKTAEAPQEQAPASTSAPATAQPQHRGLWSWLSLHPELIITIVTTTLCVALLWSFSRPARGPKLFEKETLKLYNGKKNAPLYLAILGEVFDVTKGRKHYADNKGYGGFVGRDATRAFVTGDFRGDLTDDVEGFSPEQFRSLVEWRGFYRNHTEYVSKGRLVGRFYNSEGKPTRLLRRVEAQAALAKSEEELQREAEAAWPDCNVRWTEAEGGSVWCDGGAYPRKVSSQLPGGKPTSRCACFQEVGWSDVRQVYPGCAPDAHTCKV